MAGRKKQPELTAEEKLQQALVPETEQPYKVPDNWCWTRLEILSDFERGITFPASAKEKIANESNIPCIRTANIQEELEIDDLIYVDKKYMKENENKLVRVNDIIMSSANSRELVGKVSYVNYVSEPMTFGGFVLVIRSKYIFSKFLFYFLRLEFLFGHFMGKSTQTTNIANINTANLGNYSFPLPPLVEQQRIVECIETLFAKLDEAKEKLQNTIDTFETRKAAILHKAFTGELTANWRKQRGLTMDSWEEKTLKSLSDKIGDGLHGTPNYTDNGDYAFINGNNFAGDKIEIKPETKKVDFNEYMKYKVELNDKTVFVSINGTLGKTAFYNNENIILGKSACYINVNQNLNKYYLRHFFCSKDFVNYANEKATGSTIKNLGLKAMRNLKINLPTLDEQTEIVRIIDNLLAKEQQAHSIAQNAIAKIDLIKKSILARAFRGQLATNNPADEPAIELLKRVL